MTEFSGRTAIVTGAGRGIGASIARMLAARGAAVALVDADADAIARVVADITAHGGIAEAHAGDVRDRDFADGVVRETIESRGALDVLVNNAGINRDNLIDRIEDADWDAVLDVNLKGVFHFCRAAAPHMKARRYGRIVNIGSRAWLGNVGQANYAASKAGLVGFTRTLALELARHGVTVNVVAPGLVDTEMTRRLPEKIMEKLIGKQPGGFMGTVDDVASAVCFFAAEGSAFITGQVLHVDGGKSAGVRAL